MGRLLPSLLAAVMVASASAAASADVESGNCVLTIVLGDFDPTSDFVLADLHFSIDVPAGTGTVSVPIPLPISYDTPVVVEAYSSDNLVLIGRFRSGSREALCRIRLDSLAGKIRMSVRDVTVPFEGSSEAGSGKAMNLNIGRSYERLRSLYPGEAVVPVHEIVVDSHLLERSVPAGKQVEGAPSRRSIELPSIEGNTKVTLLFRVLLRISYWRIAPVMPV